MATLPTKDCFLVQFAFLFPNLTHRIVEYIRDRLLDNALFWISAIELPLDPDEETPAQTATRQSHIRRWTKHVVEDQGWDFQRYDPCIVMNKFLYLVYLAEFKGKANWEQVIHTWIVPDGYQAQIEPEKKKEPREKEEEPREKKKTAKRRPSSPMLRESKRQKGSVPFLQDPAIILDRMLDVVATEFTDSYSTLMATGKETVKERIMQNLSPGIMSLFERKEPLHVDNLLSIRGDFLSHKRAIYMHIVRKTIDPSSFYLYIGQANNLQKRISEHRSPAYRRAHPSLHYHVLDSGSGSSADTMQGTFVLLSSCDVPVAHLQHYLNLMELFGCLLFQTLPEKTLQRFLPADVAIGTGVGLNVASPIYQGIENSGWSVMLLRDSEDPLVRAYYASKLGTGARTRRDAQLILTREGGLRTLHDAKFRGLLFSIGCLNQEFYIPVDRCVAYRLKVGDPVYVNFDVNTIDSHHPHIYARDARDDDPGKRIAVRVSGAKGNGEPYEFYISKGGEKTVKRTNSLFDFITGVEDTIDRLKVPRRYLNRNKLLGRSSNIYT